MEVAIKNPPDTSAQRYRRHNLKLPIPVTESGCRDDGHLLGLAKNISAGGLFVMTKEPMPPGAMLAVCFRVPGQGLQVRCQVRVVWARPRDPYSPYDPGMGLMFLNLDYQLVASLDYFVREQNRVLAH